MRRASRVVPALILAAMLLVLFAAPVNGKGAFGLAGRMETGPDAAGYRSGESFEWHEFLGEQSLASTDRLVLLFAIVPFEGALTIVGLDAIGGTTFLELVFDGGTIAGLPYARDNWSVIQATLDFSAGRYQLLVDDQSAGPFPFTSASNSIQAFRINAASAGSRGVGWIDTVWMLRESAAGESLLLDVTFDDGRTFNLAQGTLTVTEPFARSAIRAGIDLSYVVIGGSVAAFAAAIILALQLRRRP